MKPKRLFMYRKSAHIRRYLLRNPWSRPMTIFNYAVIKIQKTFRSFLIRKYGAKRNKALQLASTKNAKYRRIHKGKPMILDKYLKDLDSYKYRLSDRPNWIEEGFSSWCAVKLQSFWRMSKACRRVSYRRHLSTQIACLIIQSTWRTHRSRRKQLTARFNRLSAALAIQICWRSFCNRRVYAYFRELVLFKLKGLPQDLLKTIIPTEVAVCDRASGIHVRFRLGGYSFPPKIFFKIFTHRAVCDVGSFAPRDYTQESPIEPLQRHNKSSALASTSLPSLTNIRVGTKYFGAVVATATGNCDNWYRRDENNNWRPLANEAFEEILAPPWLRGKLPSKQPQHFHYNRLRRREDQVKLRKRRKREWLSKAYRLARFGTLEPQSLDDLELKSLRTDKMIASESQRNCQIPFNDSSTFEEYSREVRAPYFSDNEVLCRDPSSIKDTDEDLLRWSQALNFDEYSKDWFVTATSLPSDCSFTSMYQSSLSSSQISLPKIVVPSNPNNYHANKSLVGGASLESRVLEEMSSCLPHLHRW
jgi:hypothetical protein